MVRVRAPADEDAGQLSERRTVLRFAPGTGFVGIFCVPVLSCP